MHCRKARRGGEGVGQEEGRLSICSVRDSAPLTPHMGPDTDGAGAEVFLPVCHSHKPQGVRACTSMDPGVRVREMNKVGVWGGVSIQKRKRCPGERGGGD